MGVVVDVARVSMLKTFLCVHVPHFNFFILVYMVCQISAF